MRGNYAYFAQRIDKPADLMMGQAFTRKYEMAAWVAGREDLFRYFRYNTYDNSCKAITLCD